MTVEYRQKKERASRNRTITLIPNEISFLKSQVLTLDNLKKLSPIENNTSNNSPKNNNSNFLTDKTINADLLETLKYIPDEFKLRTTQSPLLRHCCAITRNRRMRSSILNSSFIMHVISYCLLLQVFLQGCLAFRRIPERIALFRRSRWHFPYGRCWQHQLCLRHPQVRRRAFGFLGRVFK